MRKTLLLPLNFLGAFVYNQLSTYVGPYSPDPIVYFYVSTILFDYCRFIGSPKSGSENPPGGACF